MWYKTCYEIYNEIKNKQLDAEIVLQVHDELIIECNIQIKDEVKKILQENMEKALKMVVPLKVETCEAENWYEAK